MNLLNMSEKDNEDSRILKTQTKTVDLKEDQFP